MNYLKYIKFGIIPSILIGAYWAVPINPDHSARFRITSVNDDDKTEDRITITLSKKPYSFYLDKTSVFETLKNNDSIKLIIRK